LRARLHDLCRPGQVVGTFGLFEKLNSQIDHANMPIATTRESNFAPARQQLLSRSCSIHDGSCEALGIWGAVRHRLAPWRGLGWCGLDPTNKNSLALNMCLLPWLATKESVSAVRHIG
jgi:hypothetical protein